MLELLEKINTQMIGKNLLFSVIVIVATAIVIKFSKKAFIKIKDLNPDDNSFEDLIPFLENLARLVYIGILLFTLMKIWGVDVTPLLGAAGVAGFAIAFAAQDSVSNLFGGISIFMDKPFKVGDQILIEGTKRGHIYHIGSRSTKIKTLDNVLVTIPNSKMVTNPIYNETGYDPKMRVRIALGVAYGSDLDNVETTILKVLKDNDRILENPKPVVLFTEFGDSAIELLAIGTIPNPSYLATTKHKLIKEIYKALNKENIEIPYPQREVRLHSIQQ